MKSAQLLLLSFVLLLLATPSHSQESETEKVEEKSNKELVEKAITEFIENCISDDEETRIAAIKKMLPTEEHCHRLFGEDDGSVIYEELAPRLEAMKEANAQVKKEFERNGALREIKVEDVRQAPESDRKPFDDVLSMIPEDIAVFTCVQYWAEGVSGTSSFLVIDKKVIFFRSFEDVPFFLKSLKEDDK